MEGRRGQRAGSRIWGRRRYLGGCVGRFVIHGFILEGSGFGGDWGCPPESPSPRWRGEGDHPLSSLTPIMGSSSRGKCHYDRGARLDFHCYVRQRVLGGVAAGLGRSLGIEPVYVRAGFVSLGLVYGLGLVLYLGLWAILPEEPSPYGARPSDCNPASTVRASLCLRRCIAGAARRRVLAR